MKLLLPLLFSATILAQTPTSIRQSGTLPTHCAVGEVYTKTGASAGIYACTASNTWTLQGGGGGTSILNPQSLVVTASAGTLTIGGNLAVCSATQPCNVTIGGVVHAITANATAAVSAGTDHAYVWIDSSANIRVGVNTATVTCTGCTASTSVTGFPTGTTSFWPLADAVLTSGTWATPTSDSAGAAINPVVYGTGLSAVVSGGTTTVTGTGGGATCGTGTQLCYNNGGSVSGIPNSSVDASSVTPFFGVQLGNLFNNGDSAIALTNGGETAAGYLVVTDQIVGYLGTENWAMVASNAGAGSFVSFPSGGGVQLFDATITGTAQPACSLLASTQWLEWPITNGVNGDKLQECMRDAGGAYVWTDLAGVACISAASPAVCASSSTGFVSMAAGTTTLTVNTSYVTDYRTITVFPDDTRGALLGVTCNTTLSTLTGGLAITAKTAGTSFTVSLNGAIAVNPLCLSYTIR